MQIEALLIDLDGVLRHWTTSVLPLEAKYALPSGTLRRIAFSPQLVLPSITGALTDEEWRRNIALAIERETGSDARLAVHEWSSYIGEVDHAILALIEQRREEVKLVLITNATSRLPKDLAALGLTHKFYSIINSSTVRSAKPEAEIYHAALASAGVRAQQAVFVDDQLQNVQAAVTLGIKSHQFTNHLSLKSFLEQAGVLRATAA